MSRIRGPFPPGWTPPPGWIPGSAAPFSDPEGENVFNLRDVYPQLPQVYPPGATLHLRFVVPSMDLDEEIVRHFRVEDTQPDYLDEDQWWYDYHRACRNAWKQWLRKIGLDPNSSPIDGQPRITNVTPLPGERPQL